MEVDDDYVHKCEICHHILASPAAMYTHYKLTHKLKGSMKNFKFHLKDGNKVTKLLPTQKKHR